MKKFCLPGVLLVIVCSFISFKSDTNPLVGKWEYSSTYQGGPFKLLAIFRNNGTFDGFINQKEFVSGTYHVNHDTLYMSDPTCNAKYEGSYKFEFFGQRDSLKFHVIQDTCSGRREGTNGKLFKKVITATKQ
jgi:hypothetical protein